MSQYPVLRPQYLQFVVKITKFCNLRCKYCYEFPYLSDPTKMSLVQIEQMFRNIAEYYEKRPDLKIADFIWHGGEPFVLKPAYYQAIQRLQKQIFASLPITILNKVQTNLTLLDADYIAALKNKLFDSIGVSIDLFGNDRVNIAGKPVEDKVLANMQKMLDNDILFGCITVLSRKTYPHVEKIFNFFDEIETPCRFLPIYRTGFEGQHDENGLESIEIVNALQRVFETWLQSKNAVEVDPISNYLNIALRVIQNDAAQKRIYDKAVSDTLFIVNTNGETYCTDEVYTEDASYGNLFEKPLSELLVSQGYQQAVARSRMKSTSVCHQCPYFGACIGYEMAEATVEQMFFNPDDNLECGVVRPMITYIKDRLLEENLVDALLQNGLTKELASTL